MTVALPGAPPGEDKALLNVEVCLRPDSAADLGTVRAAALQFLTSLSSVRYAEGPLHPLPGQHPLLDAHVQSIRVVDLAPGRIPAGRLLLQWDVAWQASRWVEGCCGSSRLCCTRAAFGSHFERPSCAVHVLIRRLKASVCRCACLPWTARAQQTTTRGRTAPPPTASGCCPPPSSTAAGRRWWVLALLGEAVAEQTARVMHCVQRLQGWHGNRRRWIACSARRLCPPVFACSWERLSG